MKNANDRSSAAPPCSTACPHHRDVWPLKERVGVSTYMAASWLLLWISFAARAYWFVPIVTWFICRSNRAFTRSWLAACERFGVNENDTRGA